MYMYMYMYILLLLVKRAALLQNRIEYTIPPTSNSLKAVEAAFALTRFLKYREFYCFSEPASRLLLHLHAYNNQPLYYTHTTINHYSSFPVMNSSVSVQVFFFKSPSPQAFLSNRSSSSRQGQKFAVFFFLSSPRVLEPSPLELTTGAKMSKVCGTLLFSLSESILPPGLSPIGFFYLIFSILPITFRLD